MDRANVSIIIPNLLLPDKNAELLRFVTNCVDSIRRHTDASFELIMVDNGSPIGGDYLRSVADVYIRNPHNLGFGPAVNQGLKLARGEWLIVSNNDIEFIHDWVDNAIEAWQDGTGVVSSHLHAHDRLHKVGRQVVPWGHMFGALWMTRRDVLDVVGYMDEGYGIAMYEDKHLWLTMEAAGYSLVKAGWCNHIGNATWGKMPHQKEIFFKNKARFEKQWGIE